MSKRISFITELLGKYGIGLFELLNCYNENKELVDNARQIFECRNDKEITLSSLVPELVCPDLAEQLQAQLYKNLGVSAERSSSEEELHACRLLLITAMFFNPRFYVYAFNWCYFLENDAINSGLFNQNKKRIVLTLREERDAIAASAELWPYIDNGTPIAVGEFGILRIKARKNTDTIKAIFMYNGDEEELTEVEFDFVSKSCNRRTHIVLDLVKSKELVVDAIDYSKGFIIENVSCTLR